MKTDSRNRLEDFIKRAELLESYSYLDGGKRIAGFTIREIGNGGEAEFFQPDREKTDALLLNLRVFVQDKDDISLRRLEELCGDKGITSAWKNEYLEIRRKLNERMDMIAVDGPKGALTYAQLFRMVLFGHLAHRNETDKDYLLFKKWVMNEQEWELIYNTFHQVVIWIVAAIINIGRASKEELLRQ